MKQYAIALVVFICSFLLVFVSDFTNAFIHTSGLVAQYKEYKIDLERTLRDKKVSKDIKEEMKKEDAEYKAKAKSFYKSLDRYPIARNLEGSIIKKRQLNIAFKLQSAEN